jgi:ATP-dependent RNA helicase SUPV3L1/SUV3
MSDRPTGAAPARLVAALGPTNTGKTHLAVERMLGHQTGMIGLPLRLLAREIYDRIAKARGPRAVALVTGEEKIVPPRPQYWVATVEAMPLSREVEFLAVDEIQLCADSERGHVFTHRLLHARGTAETMLLGAATMAPLVRRLLPHAEIAARDRFSNLTWSGAKKLTRLPRRSAVVAFSADQVYAIAELIRRQRGGAAVVMGSLSPRTRNAQVALYQSGDVDFLVATDAIGMGLNMDVDHVAFAGLRKFDGARTRWLTPQEVGQIAGRAGRFQRDGTFGVTGDCEEMEPELIEAVEQHRFEPVAGAEWRNAKLDFASLPLLMRSLAAPPQREGLKLSAEALDETTLKRLAQDEGITARARDRWTVERLWEVCQTPDFRKIAADDHARLIKDFFLQLTAGRRRIPDDWIARQFAGLDRTDGEIDALSARLASVRTLAYVANRPDWLADPGEWQGKTRALEDRLSDTLHEKLMARFVDRRTSALMKALRVRDDALLAGVGADGAVTVEGHYVGALRGVAFDPAQGSSVLESKALRAAAVRALGPEIARRLGKLAAEPDDAFALAPDGSLLWRAEAVGALAGGPSAAPRVRLFGELGHEAARERAVRRLEAFVASEAARRLAPLRRLEAAVAEGKIKGLARGLAYRLIEAGGILPRAEVRTETKALSPAERRSLRSLGVKLGAFAVWLPGLLKPQASSMAQALAGREAGGLLAAGRPNRFSGPLPPPRALSAYGLAPIGGLGVPVDQLEALDEALRAAPVGGGGAIITDEVRERLGWSAADLDQILKGLGFTPANRRRAGEPTAWRQRNPREPKAVEAPRTPSPFAALAALKVEAPPARRNRRRRRAAKAHVQRT